MATIEIKKASDLLPYIKDGKFTRMGESLFEAWEQALGDKFSEMTDAIPENSPLLGAIHAFYFGDGDEDEFLGDVNASTGEGTQG